MRSQSRGGNYKTGQEGVVRDAFVLEVSDECIRRYACWENMHNETFGVLSNCCLASEPSTTPRNSPHRHTHLEAPKLQLPVLSQQSNLEEDEVLRARVLQHLTCGLPAIATRVRHNLQSKEASRSARKFVGSLSTPGRWAKGGALASEWLPPVQGTICPWLREKKPHGQQARLPTLSQWAKAVGSAAE
eukprot:361780-Chlamydomonas_euryale.AAC.7